MKLPSLGSYYQTNFLTETRKVCCRHGQRYMPLYSTGKASTGRSNGTKKQDVKLSSEMSCFTRYFQTHCNWKTGKTFPVCSVLQSACQHYWHHAYISLTFRKLYTFYTHANVSTNKEWPLPWTELQTCFQKETLSSRVRDSSLIVSSQNTKMQLLFTYFHL